MPKRHVVEEGEGVSAIAFRYGFAPETVWNDPGNEELRARREDMDILSPRDVVVIPDKRLKEETRATGAVHRFQRKGVPAILRVQVTVNGQIRAKEPFTVIVDDSYSYSDVTDEEGVLEAPLSPAARRAVVTVGPDGHRFELEVGGVRPISTLAGVRSRLNNLGYDCGEIDAPEGDEATREAVLAFQRDMGLVESGDWRDEAFAEALRNVHDTTAAPPEAVDAEGSTDEGGDGATEGGTSPAGE